MELNLKRKEDFLRMQRTAMSGAYEIQNVKQGGARPHICCKDVLRQHDYYWPKAMDEYALTSVVCLKIWPSDVSGMKESDLVS